MDGLGEDARLMFCHTQSFLQDPQLQVPIITITKHSSNTVYRQADIPANEVLAHIRRPVPDYEGDRVRASLQLIKIDRIFHGTLLTTRDLFMDIFEEFDLEPYLLYLINRFIHGVHSFERQRPRTAISPASQTVHSFYVNTVSHMLIASYNTYSKTTRAIYIARKPGDGFRERPAIFGDLARALYLHRQLLDSPRFLYFICAMDALKWIDTSISHELNVVRDVESKTGHGVWMSTSGSMASTDELVTMSGTIGGILSSMANVVRHISIANALCKELNDDGDTHDPSTQHIQEAGHALKRRVETSEADTAYVIERAKNQQSVIFNLLGREDAYASKEIAIAARRDSSHMKTIAIMTMAFLPAAFFATLFALPTLKWDQPQVVQDRFYIYLYFTVPCTVLVFIAWGVLSNWKKILRLFKSDGEDDTMHDVDSHASRASGAEKKWRSRSRWKKSN